MKNSPPLWLNKTLKERLVVSEFYGDDGLIGYELSFEGLFNDDGIKEIKELLPSWKAKEADGQ